jgi:hypothetical protein
MVWFWTRDDETLRVETRYDDGARLYVAHFCWPDGRQETERYQDVKAFRRRLEEVEAALEAAQWRQNGAPIMLPAGWSRPPPGR